MTQLAMSGEDWLSDNDHKRTKRAIAARKKAALAAAKRLEAATDAVNAFLHACNECNDGSGGEVGNEATFVSWRATAHGGKKKDRKGGKRR